MGVSKTVMKSGLKTVVETKAIHSGYIVDERGNEVQITASMIRSACHQLLKQCRAIKA
ncbi:MULTISPECIES: PA1571 family protein [unclassified Acinetobacter]|uniref:PA1571 family protein n=1 Tax=unclassified Acinetobacter TaxID=196816 RepID=UPI0015D197B9|nr:MULTISPECIES: PA1571 family protein [unclassified Acinetobacter]